MIWLCWNLGFKSVEVSWERKCSLSYLACRWRCAKNSFCDCHILQCEKRFVYFFKIFLWAFLHTITKKITSPLKVNIINCKIRATPKRRKDRNWVKWWVGKLRLRRRWLWHKSFKRIRIHKNRGPRPIWRSKWTVCEIRAGCAG